MGGWPRNCCCGGAVVFLLAGAGLDAVGTGMFMAAATLYFVTVVDLVVEVGCGVLPFRRTSVRLLLSPVPLGGLAERLGAAGRVFTGLLLARAVGYAAYVFVDRYVVVLFVLTCVLVACDRAFRAAAPGGRRAGRGWRSEPRRWRPRPCMQK